MSTDPIDNLLRQFKTTASLIHVGPFCGNTPAQLIQGKGHIHVITRGWVDVRHDALPSLYVDEPTLLFYPRALPHRFLTDASSGADFLCATVAFDAGPLNPLVQALPPMLAVPLAAMPELRSTLDLLLSEAAGNRYGRSSTVDRLFEVLLALLLRRILSEGTMSTGMLAGLAHPQVGRAMLALHQAPELPWTLEQLAAVAGMSRSRFAQAFKSILGTTVGEYLLSWRLSLAQELLRRATPLKLVASKVGYGSAIALARAFRLRMGQSPHVWLRESREEERSTRLAAVL